MSVLTLILGCFILYGKSRFFPEYITPLIISLIKKNKQIASLVGYLLLVFSYILFSNKFGWGTGFVIYLVCISLFYSLLIITFSLHKKYIYILTLFSVLLLIFENTLF